jgi:mono/diheme cytochrome c family protein
MTMKHLLGFIWLIALFVSGCAAPGDVITTIVATLPTATSAAVEAVETVDPVTLAAGIAVYRQQYCGVCHILDAAETRGTFGPPHNEAAASAALHLADPRYVGAATTVAAYLYESIVNPEIHLVDGYAATAHRMPSFAHLPAEDIDALVYLLLQQK